MASTINPEDEGLAVVSGIVSGFVVAWAGRLDVSESQLRAALRVWRLHGGPVFCFVQAKNGPRFDCLAFTNGDAEAFVAFVRDRIGERERPTLRRAA